jgi:hypothetical protein
MELCFPSKAYLQFFLFCSENRDGSSNSLAKISPGVHFYFPHASDAIFNYDNKKTAPYRNSLIIFYFIFLCATRFLLNKSRYQAPF